MPACLPVAAALSCNARSNAGPSLSVRAEHFSDIVRMLSPPSHNTFSPHPMSRLSACWPACPCCCCSSHGERVRSALHPARRHGLLHVPVHRHRALHARQRARALPLRHQPAGAHDTDPDPEDQAYIAAMLPCRRSAWPHATGRPWLSDLRGHGLRAAVGVAHVHLPGLDDRQRLGRALLPGGGQVPTGAPPRPMHAHSCPHGT